MSRVSLKHLRLSDRDLDFLVDTASPEVTNKPKLKQIIREDEDFRNSFVTDDKVFRKLMDDEEISLKISPTLFFEVLLRKAVKDLAGVSYTVERTSTMRIPVFDTKEVVEILTKESLLLYLADMLSSFTKIESYAISFRVGKGIWKKIRFNDLDIHSLMSLCGAVEDEYRLGFYKRIADICLFILGIFPDYAERDYRYPFSGQLRPQIRGKVKISPEEYEKEGRRFYKLAAEHQSARELNLSEVFWTLHGNFQKAKKPLNFITEHYLNYKRQKCFV
ncbi:MAG: hypothetical protein JSW12_21940 [Deltaproteobacteria bacterium]|nr:MAG: hypothetical protein JSW12_21940 [Deltaproteobacteria bacterium]